MTNENVPLSFRDRVLAGEAVVGTFLNVGSAVTAEICALAGFDWVLVDLEHGSGSQADLVGQVQAVARRSAVLVRVELTARTPCSRALDAGADGIMFPRIETAAEAAEAVRYLRFPPDGVRGVAVQNRVGRFGQVPLTALGETDDDVLGVVQIETTRLLGELDALAAVDGVDVLFVGPGDLSFALGIPGALGDPRYLEALAAVVAAAGRHGKSPGILVPNAAEAARARDRGFRFIGVGSDSALVMSGARGVVEAFRSRR